jgi:hypothetical protein
MRMVDIIIKKRSGLELTKEEIDFVINGFTNSSIPDYQMSSLAMAIVFNGMNKKEIGYLLKSISLDLLVYIFVSALISFLCVFMKNVGMSIVSYFGIVILMLAVVSILSVVILFVPESSQGLKNFYQFLLDINFLNHTTVIGLGEYAKYQELKIFLSDLIGIGAFVGFGVLAFNKKDLK